MDHISEFKVYSFHLDAYGHVNNARYQEFLEAARWEFTEAYMDMKYFEEHQLAFVVAGIQINYKYPATGGQVLQIHSRLSDLGESSGKVIQEIRLKKDDRLIVDARVTFVIVDIRTGRPVRISGDLRSVFERLLT